MSNQSQTDYTLKFIVIGEPAVGKSCLSSQFQGLGFRPWHEVTIGVEFGSKIINVNGK